MKIIYVAGPYRGENPIDVKRNIREADTWGEQIVGQTGVMVLVPHKNTEGYEGLQDDQFFLDGTLELMRRCDAVWLIPGWEQSKGAIGEMEEAKQLGIPVFEDWIELVAWATE